MTRQKAIAQKRRPTITSPARDVADGHAIMAAATVVLASTSTAAQYIPSSPIDTVF